MNVTYFTGVQTQIYQNCHGHTCTTGIGVQVLGHILRVQKENSTPQIISLTLKLSKFQNIPALLLCMVLMLSDLDITAAAGSQPHHRLQSARLLLPLLRPHLAAPLRQPEDGVGSLQPVRRRAHQLPGARFRQGPRHR